MRRSVALVAAAVTTFSLVVLVSVVYAYRGLAVGPASAPVGASQSVKTVPVADTGSAQVASGSQLPSLSQAANSSLSVEAAASIASKFLNRTDLLSAELTTYSGSPAYKIAFSLGAAVYVSMSGEVLGEELPPTYSTATSLHRGSGGNSFSPSSHSSGEHEDGTEHESEGSSTGGGD